MCLMNPHVYTLFNKPLVIFIKNVAQFPCKMKNILHYFLAKMPANHANFVEAFGFHIHARGRF